MDILIGGKAASLRLEDGTNACQLLLKDGEFSIKYNGECFFRITGDSMMVDKRMYLKEEGEHVPLRAERKTSSHHMSRDYTISLRVMMDGTIEKGDETRSVKVNRVGDGRYIVDYSSLELQCIPTIIVTPRAVNDNITISNIVSSSKDSTTIIIKNSSNIYVNCSFNLIINISG